MSVSIVTLKMILGCLVPRLLKNSSPYFCISKEVCDLEVFWMMRQLY